HMYVVLAKNNAAQTYILCQRASNATNTSECFFHAITLLIRGPRLTSEGMSQLCQPVVNSSKGYTTCVDVAISALLESSASYQGVAITFCNNIAAAYRSSCMSYMQKTMKEAVLVQQVV